MLNRSKTEILPDDIFLVSYPRSGNTWVRFILANIIYKDENINFTNIHKYCPEFGKSNDISTKAQIPRIIKSHEHFNSAFPKVIYMVRDGRDSYVSYYHYLKNKLPASMAFKDFIEEGSMPYGRWCDHVLSWIDSGKPLLIIRYEDLFTNALNTVRNILEFIKAESDDQNIKAALNKTTYNEMKGIETQYGRGENKSGPEIFMRKGRIGDWKNYFGNTEKEIFKRIENHVLLKLNYEKTSDW